MKEETKMFCPNPFTRLEIKPNGDVYCCCEGWLPKPIGNVLESNLLDLWSSSTAVREIRKSILDGNFQYCLACPYLPGPGGPVVEGPPPDLAIPSDLSMNVVGTLKLDYDQSCNLTCPSCRITHSREFVDVPKVTQIHEAILRSGVLEHTRRLYVTGSGDPFASELYWNFLRTLHLHELHPELEIFLHTNGLLLDQYHWDNMGFAARSRVTEIGISIDAATEKTYRFVRQASWSKLWSNIGFVNGLQTAAEAERRRPIMLGMFYTVQAANFREVLPFIKLAWNHRVSWISITALRNWGTFTEADYRSRSVHLPEHPDHAEFRQMISDTRLTKDPRIVLDSFNPAYVDQIVITNPGALLPENRLRQRH